MAINAEELTDVLESATQLDYAEVIVALKDITKPYHLGIQLKIDSSILKTFEGNYSKDIDRQKTEVIEYWLCNSPDASWTTLANAVERMRGHARLAERLRKMEQRYEKHPSKPKVQELSHKATVCIPGSEIPSRSTSLNTAAQRKILLLDSIGHGKSTLGNRILNSDSCFKINDQKCPQTLKGKAIYDSVSQLKNYKIKVYDHNGLFEGATSISTLSSIVQNKLDLVMFVLKRGCNFDESEVETLVSVISEWRISRISALILTHCERFQRRRRKK